MTSRPSLGRLLHTIRHTTPDSKLVVTGHDDGTARLWELRGRTLAELKGHQGSVTSAAFSPDGKLVVTASDDGTARLWPCNLCGTPEALIGEMSHRVGRELTDQEREMHGLPPLRTSKDSSRTHTKAASRPLTATRTPPPPRTRCRNRSRPCGSRCSCRTRCTARPA